MRGLLTGLSSATRCTGTIGESVMLLHKSNPARPFASQHDGSAVVFQRGSRRISSSASSCSSGRGSAVRNAAQGFLSRLKGLYLEMQMFRDRQLDVAAAEEARGGMARILEENDRVLSATTGSAKYATHGRNGSEAQNLRCRSPLISRNPTLCPRSVLFVPCSKPRALAKVPTLPADCFILDLEDSVGGGSKRQARENLRAFIEEVQREQETQRAAQAATAGGGSDGWYPRLVVRINSPDYNPATAMLDLELVGQLGPAIEGIALPKTTVNTHQLIKDYVYPSHQLWAFFESPRSVIQAPLICEQGVYQYAVMGYNDLSAALQLPLDAPSLVSGTTDGGPVSEAVKESLYISTRLPLWQSTVHVLLAARAHDMFVLDGVFNDPTDKVGFRRSLQECRRLGLNGKTLIHPDQITPTNTLYTPAEAEVLWAHRVIEEVQRFEGGVSTVDGKMQEGCHQRQAEYVLALHRSAELEKRRSMSKALQGTADTGASRQSADCTIAADAAGDNVIQSGPRPRRTPSRHRPVV
ncbi:hypothetical protein JKF63_05627 [Porcisia hertigi]|uniref:HpcH/HpaI aldolase/citrate lyase domain-containing protein n=1 Tax=Porcisia hertigi TaxID=2761500 RepID=A0A836IUC8_9TRYP|nr:hypothetical protein JKF63_05627 [Porcisia hertigi]